MTEEQQAYEEWTRWALHIITLRRWQTIWMGEVVSSDLGIPYLVVWPPWDSN